MFNDPNPAETRAVLRAKIGNIPLRTIPFVRFRETPDRTAPTHVTASARSSRMLPSLDGMVAAKGLDGGSSLHSLSQATLNHTKPRRTSMKRGRLQRGAVRPMQQK